MIVNLQILKAQLGGIQTKLNFDTVLPFVKLAERQFKNDIGPELYELLADGELEAESEELELRELAQAYLSWTAYDLAMPHLKLRVGDMGLMKSSPANTVAVTKWEYVDTREANILMSDLYLELFWELLEKVAPEVWIESESFEKRNEYFVTSAAELKKFAPWLGRNARLFDKLLPYIDQTEDERIRPLLTDEVFDDLKQKTQDPETVWDLAEKKLLKLVKKLTSMLAIEAAMPYLALVVDEKGFREVRKKDGTQEEEVAEKGPKNRLLQKIHEDARAAEEALRQYLDKNASAQQWPSYYEANVSEDDTPDEDDFSDTKSIIL